MGSGRWDWNVYDNTTGSRIRNGKTFGYSRATSASAPSNWRAHPTLDPLGALAGKDSPFAGRNIRESRDSNEHPQSTPIAVFFDETGSMGHVPRLLQEKLGELFKLLVAHDYVTDPQLMVGAYGDAECDYVPLQASHFESDNRIDEALNNLFLEGNGGGNGHETAALAWYFAGMHTATDAWDRRRKRGYLFTIGDERTGGLTSKQIKRFTGDKVRGDVSARQALKLAQVGFDVYHLVINNHAAAMQRSIEHYTELLGDRCVVLEDAGAAAQTIAGIIGFSEGNLLRGADFAEDLGDVGTPRAQTDAAMAAVGRVAQARIQQAIGR